MQYDVHVIRQLSFEIIDYREVPISQYTEHRYQTEYGPQEVAYLILCFFNFKASRLIQTWNRFQIVQELSSN